MGYCTGEVSLGEGEKGGRGEGEKGRKGEGQKWRKGEKESAPLAAKKAA
jgi:hypothetical protein